MISLVFKLWVSVVIVYWFFILGIWYERFSLGRVFFWVLEVVVVWIFLFRVVLFSNLRVILVS